MVAPRMQLVLDQVEPASLVDLGRALEELRGHLIGFTLDHDFPSRNREVTSSLRLNLKI